MLCTTPAPAGVVPVPPNSAPRSLRSVSAKKLSDGGSVRPSSCATVGEETCASSTAPGGVGAAPLEPRMLTPSPFSALHSALAA